MGSREGKIYANFTTRNREAYIFSNILIIISMHERLTYIYEQRI